MKKVLIISHDKVGKSMAGPGMRYHQIALELSKYFDVTLSTFNPAYLDDLQNVPYKFEDIKVFDFRKAFDKVDVIIALWLSEEMITYAKSKNIQLVFDVYAPVPVENLVNFLFSKRDWVPEDDYNYAVSVESYKRFFETGDYFLCSNDMQKDFWTGFAFATGSVLPSTYNSFPMYDRIGICAMGTNLDELKKPTKKYVIHEKFPSIKKTDTVIVWTGGIWDWFDAQTPITAIKQLEDEGISDVKLVFLATRHPNPDVPEMGETEKAFALAEKLGLKDKSVFFLPGWMEYNKRLDYFGSGDIALYAHKPSIEARFSHRTRVLDHILTALPTVATAGDYFADYVAEHNLGISVEPENVKAMAGAIKDLRDAKKREEMSKNIMTIRKEFSWTETMKPLVEFLKEDHPVRKLPTSSPLKSPVATLSTAKSLKLAKRILPRSTKELIKRHLVKRSSRS